MAMSTAALRPLAIMSVVFPDRSIPHPCPLLKGEGIGWVGDWVLGKEKELPNFQSQDIKN
jgi:hypothetical protein